MDRLVVLVLLSSLHLGMGSTEKQRIQAEGEPFAISENQSPSHSSENGKIQRCLDS
jgi:hypothetical protein